MAIREPTYGETWSTDALVIDLGGLAATPGGAFGDCDPPNYTIAWQNEATGEVGSGFSYSYFTYSPLGKTCETRWRAEDIDLVLGDNPIIVELSDASGPTGGDCIVVTRHPDTTPPAILSTSPADSAANVALNAEVIVVFSEPVDPVSVTAKTLLLNDQHGTPVGGTVSFYNRNHTVKFTPSDPLLSPRIYTATITAGARDASGNTLQADYSWSFTTGSVFDTTPPAVTAIDPPEGSNCTFAEIQITATFDEPLDPGTLNTATFHLSNLFGDPVPGTVIYSQKTAFFKPFQPLTASESYTVTLTTGVHDIAGNAMASDFSWSFAAAAEKGQWQPTTIATAPLARDGHVAVWTGGEMIVAGGIAWDPGWQQFMFTSTGGRYDPATDSWREISAEAPARMNSTAVWTGTEMIVWGGTASGSRIASGAAYNPAADTWRGLPTAGAPANAAEHTAVWTGREMIIWGGVDRVGNRLASGARYEPETDTWRPLSDLEAPSARERHTAVWTGTEMIIWGGIGGSHLFKSGAKYHPESDTWTSLSLTGAPVERYGHTAVWTGNEMVVWGDTFGSTNSGGRYAPTTNSWQPTSTHCAPGGRGGHTATWTGREMVVWGGWYLSASTEMLRQGAIYDPVTDAWRPTSTMGAPSPRYGHSAIWDGTQLIIWGGRDGGSFKSGGLLVP